MSSKGAERRRHPRRSVSEAVLLKRTGSDPVDIHAHLLDVSEAGFRASHDCANLRPGDEVMFHSPLADLAEGAGRVVWTMICGNRIESGFLILNHDE